MTWSLYGGDDVERRAALDKARHDRAVARFGTGGDDMGIAGNMRRRPRRRTVDEETDTVTEEDVVDLSETTIDDIKAMVERGELDAEEVLAEERARAEDARVTLIDWLEAHQPDDLDRALAGSIKGAQEFLASNLAQMGAAFERESAGKNRSTLLEWIATHTPDDDTAAGG